LGGLSVRVAGLVLEFLLLMVLVASALVFPNSLEIYFARLDLVIWLITGFYAVSFNYNLLKNPYIRAGELLRILGFTLIMAGRVYSVLAAAVSIPLRLFIGGCINTGDFQLTIPLVSAGVLFSLTGGLTHGIGPLFRNPIRGFAVAGSFLIKHPVLTSGLIAFSVRLMPEVYYSSYIIGYDTVEYVAHLRDYVASPSIIGVYYWFGYPRRIPPLLDWLLYPLALVVDPVIIFKFYPAVMYSVLTSLTVYYGVRVLKLNNKTGLLLGLISSLSLIMLRLSWDLMKQLLAEALFLAALIMAERRRPVIPGVFFILSSLASEFGGFVSGVVSAIISVIEIARHRSLLNGLFYLATSIASYSMAVYFMNTPPVTGNPLTLFSPPVVGFAYTSEQGAYIMAYILLTLAPLLPFYVSWVLERKHETLYSPFVSLALLLLTLTPFITPVFNATNGEWDRVLMFATPIIMASSLSEISKVKSRGLAATTVLLISLPGFYAILPGGELYNAQIYQTLYRTPTLLKPMPPDLFLYNAGLNVAHRASEMYGRDVIIAPEWIIRFIHLYVRNPDPSLLIVYDGDISQATLRELAASHGHLILITASTPPLNQTGLATRVVFESYFLRIVEVNATEWR
jgi:hypothetical protein